MTLTPYDTKEWVDASGILNDESLSETLKGVLKERVEQAAEIIKQGMPVEVTLWNEMKQAILTGIAMAENRNKKRRRKLI
jgi:hypothetical protein